MIISETFTGATITNIYTSVTGGSIHTYDNVVSKRIAIEL